MRRGVAALQQSAAHNHTAAMMEMGSSLLNQTAAQTRKLTDVEAQVSVRAATPGDSDSACSQEAQWASGGSRGAGQEEAGRAGRALDRSDTRTHGLTVSAAGWVPIPQGPASCSSPSHVRCLTCCWTLEVSSSKSLAARAENKVPGRGQKLLF